MHGGDIPYLNLLRQNHGFRRLWLGQVVSLLGDWLSYVAVLGLVLDLTGSGLAVAATMLARALPYTACGLVAGVILDRTDRRRVLLMADLGRGLLALAYLAVREPGDLWLVYLLGAGMQALSAFFNPGLSALVPAVCRDTERRTANSLLQATQGAAMVAGAAAGGLLVAWFGYGWAFALNGLSFLVSAACILGLAVPVPAERGVRPGPLAEFRAGWQFIRSQPVVRALILRRVGERLGAGFNILLSVYARQVWAAGDTGIGWLYSATGLGIIAGSWAARRWGAGRPGAESGADAPGGGPARLIAWGGTVEVLGWLAFAFAPNLAVGAAMAALMVAGDVMTQVTEVTCLQQVAPGPLQGRVFAAREALLTLAWAVALSATGWALEQAGPRTVAAGIAGIMGLPTLIWWAAAPGMRAVQRRPGGAGARL